MPLENNLISFANMLAYKRTWWNRGLWVIGMPRRLSHIPSVMSSGASSEAHPILLSTRRRTAMWVSTMLTGVKVQGGQLGLMLGNILVKQSY